LAVVTSIKFSNSCNNCGLNIFEAWQNLHCSWKTIQAGSLPELVNFFNIDSKRVGEDPADEG
jgi:hypothetical protein